MAKKQVRSNSEPGVSPPLGGLFDLSSGGSFLGLGGVRSTGFCAIGESEVNDSLSIALDSLLPLTLVLPTCNCAVS